MKSFIKTIAVIFFLVWAIIAVTTVASLAQGCPTGTCQTYSGTTPSSVTPSPFRKGISFSRATYKAINAERSALLRDEKGMAIIGPDGKPLKKGQALPNAGLPLTGTPAPEIQYEGGVKTYKRG